LSIIHYIITPPRLRRYPSYLKRGVGSHLPYNRPLKIRGQALPPGSAGVMIFWGRSQLRVLVSSWQIKVLPSRQVSDDDSCRRINSAVMKIRLFKPKTLSNTEISIAVEAFNSPANVCLKGNNLHNRRYATCGQRRPCNLCLKVWILNILNALMVYIFLFEKLSVKPNRSRRPVRFRQQVHKWISTPAKKEQTKRKFVI